jgi:hypothetical protein
MGLGLGLRMLSHRRPLGKLNTGLLVVIVVVILAAAIVLTLVRGFADAWPVYAPTFLLVLGLMRYQRVISHNHAQPPASRRI